MMGTTTILFLAANPTSDVRLQLDEEVRAITEKIRASENRDFINLISRWAVRPDDLLQALSECNPHIVHFSGHSHYGRGVVLHDDNNNSILVSKEALEKLFCALPGNIRLVVFNSCFSIEQATTVCKVVDCAVGTSNSIGDKTAIIFAASFYRGIGFGYSIKEAFEQGKAAVSLAGKDDSAFSLITRKGVDASSIILVNDLANPSRPLDIFKDQVSIDRFYRRT